MNTNGRRNATHPHQPCTPVLLAVQQRHVQHTTYRPTHSPTCHVPTRYSSTAARTAVREYVHSHFVAVSYWDFYVLFTICRHIGDRGRHLSTLPTQPRTYSPTDLATHSPTTNPPIHPPKTPPTHPTQNTSTATKAENGLFNPKLFTPRI